MFCRTVGMAMARRGRHKLIARAGHDASMLFDLAEDPGETHDLSGQVDGPVESDLHAALEDFLARPVEAVDAYA